ncbi:MAG: hypothetical protein M3O86_02180 [Actinomycetota bacterium]|nr:hypothetical protein [Actinomycetota bacterium]
MNHHPRRRGALALLVVLGVVAVGCGVAADPSAPQSRQVLVDYVSDEVASSFLYYFPRNVTVRPGDSVVFRQEWTGEPHSVTMGTMVDDMMSVVAPFIEEYGDRPEEEIPKKVLKTANKALKGLPFMLDGGPDGLTVAQNVAQPCYLDTGGPPQKQDTPCADEQQVQPAFNGRQSYYNSGFIPYQGPRGNEFTVELADDIEPGVYNYYCNVHGPFQSGTITVADEGATIPSQEDVSRQARAEIEAEAEPLVSAFEAAPREGKAEIFGMTVAPPLAGWGIEEPGSHTTLNEFIPRDLEVAVGEPVEWTFVGFHTVSFEVPEYFAQVVIEDDGTVVFSEDATQPVNSPTPEPPEGGGSGPPDGEEGGGEEGGGEGEGPPGPPEPPVIDAGTWDGEEFISSGTLEDGAKYRLAFSKPGSYPYACLIHPQMVGTVEVR